MVLRVSYEDAHAIKSIQFPRISLMGGIEEALTTSRAIVPHTLAMTRDVGVLMHSVCGVRNIHHLPRDPEALSPMTEYNFTAFDVGYDVPSVTGIWRLVRAINAFFRGQVMTYATQGVSAAITVRDVYDALGTSSWPTLPEKSATQTLSYSALRHARGLVNPNVTGRWAIAANEQLRPDFRNFPGSAPLMQGADIGVSLGNVPGFTHPYVWAVAHTVLLRHSATLSTDARLTPANVFGSDAYRDAAGAAHGRGLGRVTEARLRRYHSAGRWIEALTLWQLMVAYAVAQLPFLEAGLRMLDMIPAGLGVERRAVITDLIKKIGDLRDTCLDGFLRGVATVGATWFGQHGEEVCCPLPVEASRPSHLPGFLEDFIEAVYQDYMSVPSFTVFSPPPVPLGPGSDGRFQTLGTFVLYSHMMLFGPTAREGAPEIKVKGDDMGMWIRGLLEASGVGSGDKNPFPSTTVIRFGAPLITDGFRYSYDPVASVMLGWGEPPTARLDQVEGLRDLRTAPYPAVLERGSSTLDLGRPDARLDAGLLAQGPPSLCVPRIKGAFLAALPRSGLAYTNLARHIMPEFESMGEHLMASRPADVHLRHDLVTDLMRLGIKLSGALFSRGIAPLRSPSSGRGWAPLEAPAYLRTSVRAWLLLNQTTGETSVADTAPVNVPPDVTVHPGWRPFPALNRHTPNQPVGARIAPDPWDIVNLAALASSASPIISGLFATPGLTGDLSLFIMSRDLRFQGTWRPNDSSPMVKQRDQRWTNRFHSLAQLNIWPAGGWLVSSTTTFAAKVLGFSRMPVGGFSLSEDGVDDLKPLCAVDYESIPSMESTTANRDQMIGIAEAILNVASFSGITVTLDGTNVGSAA